MIAEKKVVPKTEPEPKVEPKKKLSKRIVSYSEYLAEATELLKDGPIQGMTKSSHVATALIYQHNTVIAQIMIKGETYFVCES